MQFPKRWKKLPTEFMMQKKLKTNIHKTSTPQKIKRADPLISNSDLLKAVLDNSNDIIIVYNLKKKKLSLINKNITKILKYKIKDIKNLKDEDIHNLMHSDDYKNYKTVYEKNISYNFSFEYRLKLYNTKNYKWFREKIYILTKDKSGKPEKLLYIITDITDYKDLEQKFLEQKEKLTELENLQQYIKWELDLKTNKITGTESLYSLLELNPKTKINKEQFLKYIHPEDVKIFKSALSNVLKGVPQYITSRIITKLGEEKYISTNLKPIFNSKNKVIRISAITSDISERKMAEKKLKEYADELKELNKSKGKYFSIIAHDLRGPFTGLLGFSNLLKEEFDYLTREEIKHYINLINSSSKNIYGLIENLLQWSRLQTGRLLFQPDNVNLNTILQEVITIYKPQAINKYIDIVLDIPEDTYVYADENMIKSIFQNLISNSIKFSDEGGKIIIGAEQNNNKYTITVSDTGIGIHPEVIDKLFNIDFHYTTPGTRDERGSGLGLILCKEFIEKHGSQIKVKSEQKIGTTISFDLKKGKAATIKK